MPVTYSRSPSTQPPYLAGIFDVDESIVLSDLVRSGEVSRLRRRGAIAIRDSITPQSPVSPSTSGIRRHSSAPFLHPPPRPEPDTSENDEDDAEHQQNGASRWFARFRPSFEEPPPSGLDNTGLRPLTPGAEGLPQDGDGDSSSSYALFCGGRPRDCDWSNPFNAPLTLDPPSRRRVFAFRPPPPARRPSHLRARRTNGCGVLVHLNAQPRRRQGTWVARGAAAAESVARMDSRYFDCRVAARLTKSACGCVREGVGCRVCGNPLGIIYVPCQAAADGLSTPQTISSVPPLTGRTQTTQNGHAAQPSGPNYWLPTCHRRRNAVTEEIYNFFSENVRAAPEFTFPPRPSSEVPPSWSWTTRPPSPMTPVALASQYPPATSTPLVPFPPWWTFRLSTPVIDNAQASDPHRAGGSHYGDGDTTPSPRNDDDAEADGAEKSEDSGPDHGPLWWVEL